MLVVSGVLIGSAFGQSFEESVSTNEIPEKPKISVGADFAMQFQSLRHHANVDLIPLGSNINLPTANLVINALLAQGIKVNLETYLSSRHHVEAWVKGGYLLIDRLPFIKSKFTDRLMDFMTFKTGVMEINYGDAHFRRSDNGKVINNLFVGNYILDAFTTAPSFEALFRSNGILMMGAISTGTLKPSLVGYNAGTQTYSPYNAHEELAFYWKAGYDNQITDHLRLRATLSGYHASNHHFGSLHNGDRTGSRYYLVMNRVSNSPDDVNPAMNHMSGTWIPGFTDKDNSIMMNLFARYRVVEFFVTYETVTATPAFGGPEFKYTQYAGEGVLRFGNEEQFYGGFRYNYVKNDTGSSINRIQAGGGWLLTPNILVKAEYVDQNYSGFEIYGGTGGFNGVMIETSISF
ncbi:MAG TPA: hypothetical protein DDW27_05825 [Bacteroidales bacterium]|nr:hypothetical protein [Bacteroidales bacterium]